jgi:hypothetical protein
MICADVEVGGLIELPLAIACGPQKDRWRIVSASLSERPRERVLLQLLGSLRQVELPASAVISC